MIRGPGLPLGCTPQTSLYAMRYIRWPAALVNLDRSPSGWINPVQGAATPDGLSHGTWKFGSVQLA